MEDNEVKKDAESVEKADAPKGNTAEQPTPAVSEGAPVDTETTPVDAENAPVDAETTENATIDTENTETTENALVAAGGEKSVGKVKKQKKAKKPPKMVSVKKLPGMLKKSYTRKALERKILRRIFVPADRAYVASLFTEDTAKKGKAPVEMVHIDRAMMIERRQVKRLKKIVKDVKAQKFGFKVAPFAAVVILIFAAVTVITTFKNVVARKVIVGAMQGVFNAKCDIEYLNLSIMGGRLEVRGLAQANKNDVMRNIFEVGDIIFDFNLTEALRGKVDIENITVSDIAAGTERKTSGYLPPKVKTAEEIAKEEAAAKKSAERKADLIRKTRNTLNNMFSDYDPRNILANIEANLKSPDMARQTQEMVETLIDKWKDTPMAMEKSVMDFSKSVEAVIKTDWGRMNDPVKIRDAIITIDNSVQQGKALKEDTEKTIREFVADSKAAVNLSKDIAEAIKSDTKLIDKELDRFRDLKDRGIKGVFNDMLTAFIYGMADQYSPYIRVGLNYLAKIQKESAANAAKKQAVLGDKPKKKVVKRAKGRNIYWRRNTVPKVLVQKVYGSGPNWMFDVREVSSDADMRGKPATLNTAFTIGRVGTNVDAVIDTRKSSSAPLVTANYVGTGIPTNVVIESYGMKSTSLIKAAVSGGSSGKFTASGSIDMGNVQILTPSFEPKVVYDIYLGAISSFTDMSMGFNAVYTKDDGFDISLNTDIGDRLQQIFMETLRRETNKVIDYAKEQAVSLLSEKTGGATDKIAEFMGIDNLMEIQKVNVDELNKKLEDIGKQLRARLEAETRKAAEEGIKQLNSKAEEALKDAGVDKYLKDAGVDKYLKGAAAAKEGANNGADGNTSPDTAAPATEGEEAVKKDPLKELANPKNLKGLFGR